MMVVFPLPVLYFVDEDAACFLCLLQFQVLHVGFEKFGLHVFPLPAAALLAVLQLYPLHGGDELVGFVVVLKVRHKVSSHVKGGIAQIVSGFCIVVFFCSGVVLFSVFSSFFTVVSRPGKDGVEREFIVPGFKTSTMRICQHSRMDVIVQI